MKNKTIHQSQFGTHRRFGTERRFEPLRRFEPQRRLGTNSTILQHVGTF